MSNIKDELKNILGKDLTEKVKAFLKLNAIPVSVKLADITLTDGTVMTVDVDAVGGNATITSADGVIPAPDGEYVDSVDGDTYTIVGGIITELEPKAVESTEPVEPSASAPASDANMSAITELKALVAKMEKQSNEKFANLIKENNSLKAGLQISLSAIEKINDTPIATALEFQKTPKADLSKIPYEQMTNHQKLIFNRENK